jgi:hypothetical protein
VDTAAFLTRERQTIIDAAQAALTRAHSPHYESADASDVHQRLETLFDYLLDALRARNLGPIVAYAQEVAQERFGAGYNLSEVQTAFNALEEATWGCVFTELQPRQFAEALGLVSTILGAAKDALAREYVSLATNRRAPSLDLQALFAGREGLAQPERRD